MSLNIKTKKVSKKNKKKYKIKTRKLLKKNVKKYKIKTRKILKKGGKRRSWKNWREKQILDRWWNTLSEITRLVFKSPDELLEAREQSAKRKLDTDRHKEKLKQMGIVEGVVIPFDNDGDTYTAPYAGMQEFVVLALVKRDGKAPSDLGDFDTYDLYLENILSVYKLEKESGKSSWLFDKEIVARDVIINDKLLYKTEQEKDIYDNKNIGDLVYQDDEIYIILDKIYVDTVYDKWSKSFMPVNRDFSNIVTEECNKIVLLIHGTEYNVLLSILKDDAIYTGEYLIEKGKLLHSNAPVDMREPSVSTYPVYNCDIGKKLPFDEMYGNIKIIIDPDEILQRYTWSISERTDNAGKGDYTKGNISKFFDILSENRHVIWGEKGEREADKMRDNDYDDAKWPGDSYLGELAFTNLVGNKRFIGIENIKQYIKYLYVSEKIDDTQVDTLRKLGLTVCRYNKDNNPIIYKDTCEST
jgi:hypothetical protein